MEERRKDGKMNVRKTYIMSSSYSVWSFTRIWIMGSAKTKPATRRTHVERNRLKYLLKDRSYEGIKATSERFPLQSEITDTYGTPTASARQTPAAAADCNDLSVENKPAVSEIPATKPILVKRCCAAIQGLTESCKVCQLGGIVGHGSHKPVSTSLPHRIQKTTEDVQPHMTHVIAVMDIDFMRSLLNFSRKVPAKNLDSGAEMVEGSTYFS